MGERLNVKGMVVEPTPEPISVFVPERDVTDEQKNGLVDAMDTWAASREWEDLPAIAWAAKLAGIATTLSADWQEQVQNMSARFSMRGDWSRYVDLVAYEKLLGWPVNISTKERAALESRTIANDLDSGYTSFAVSRELLGIHVPFDPVRLQQMNVQAQESAQEGSWYIFGLYGRYAKILGGQIQLGDKERKGMREFRLRYAQEESWSSFAVMVFSEAVISAETVTIPAGGGLQLSWNEKPDLKDVSSPSLPESRKF